MVRKNNYLIEKKKQFKKIKNLKKLFNSNSITLKNFEKNLNKYYLIHKDFIIWRKNFKYPELDYLRRLDTITPKPSDKLISDLAISLCELKGLFITLKSFRAGAIFKLFLSYISECLKVKYKIKYSTRGYFNSSPASMDVTTISGLIMNFFLNIDSYGDDPKAQYSCGCKKTKGYKIYKAYEDLYNSDNPNDFSTYHKKYLCKHKKCQTSLSKDPIRPWNEDPDMSVIYASEGNNIEGKDYKKKLKEFNTLIKKKDGHILFEKNSFGGSPDKILVAEKLIRLFFEINFFLDKDKVEIFLFNIHNKKVINKNDTRIILNKTKYDVNNREEITLYWGETKNNKPHGKGISEKYEINDINKKVVKSLSPLWWKKYSRDLKAKDLVGHIILEKYEGEWAEGKKNGKGKLITYTDPAFVSNKDWTPEIYEISKGNFKNDIFFDGTHKEFGPLGSSKIYINGKEKKN